MNINMRKLVCILWYNKKIFILNVLFLKTTEDAIYHVFDSLRNKLCKLEMLCIKHPENSFQQCVSAFLFSLFLNQFVFPRAKPVLLISGSSFKANA